MTTAVDTRRQNREGATHTEASASWKLLANGITVTVEAAGWDPWATASALVSRGFAVEVENEIAKLRNLKPFERLLQLQGQRDNANKVLAEQATRIADLRAGLSAASDAKQLSKIGDDIRTCEAASADAKLMLTIVERDMPGEVQRSEPLVQEAIMALEQRLQARVDSATAAATENFYRVARAPLERLAVCTAMESAKGDLFFRGRMAVLECPAPLGYVS